MLAELKVSKPNTTAETSWNGVDRNCVEGERYQYDAAEVVGKYWEIHGSEGHFALGIWYPLAQPLKTSLQSLQHYLIKFIQCMT